MWRTSPRSELDHRTWRHTRPSPPQCTTLTTAATGPYYMLAFPIGGTPTVQHIGDNVSDLSWTVDQPPGSSSPIPHRPRPFHKVPDRLFADSQLFLSVIDSNDTAGGVVRLAVDLGLPSAEANGRSFSRHAYTTL